MRWIVCSVDLLNAKCTGLPMHFPWPVPSFKEPVLKSFSLHETYSRWKMGRASVTPLWQPSLFFDPGCTAFCWAITTAYTVACWTNYSFQMVFQGWPFAKVALWAKLWINDHLNSLPIMEGAQLVPQWNLCKSLPSHSCYQCIKQ